MSKIGAMVIVMMLVFVDAGASPLLLQKADSLYATKQYTQAFDLYQTIFKGKQYSPAMLLKMAFIQEARGRLGESLYYLNLYYLVTSDTQALKKMEEMAKKNSLDGYETNESIKVLAWWQGQYTTIAFGLALVAAFLLALSYYQRVKKHIKPSAASLGMVLILALLFIHINFGLPSERGIVAQPKTYLMSGPSSGASVVAVIGEGHQLKIKGKKDVWLHVEWKERDVYVRESQLHPVRL